MHVMIDLETASTRMDAAILSIGAVRFDTKRVYDYPFYRAITLDSNTSFGRHISGDTVRWWMGQSEQARAVFTDPQAVHLAAALQDLCTWLRGAKTCNPAAVEPEPVYVWGNGANFDISILQSSYEAGGIPLPWGYRDVRCMRTVRSLSGADCVATPENPSPHNALSDAKCQAEWLIAAWEADTGTVQL